MDIKLFGTEKYFLRPSMLEKLMRCQLNAVELMSGGIADSGSSIAADTGSLVHAGVAEYHITGEVQAGLDKMNQCLRQFPLADKDEARLYYKAYTADPRTSPEESRVTFVEEPVSLVLEPHPSDPTGERIYIRGTVDQIHTEADGSLSVWDLKTGRGDGFGMLNSYALQQAAYVLGVQQTYSTRVVKPGGLIVAYGWRKQGVDPKKRPPGVFWHYPLTYNDCVELMGGVKLAVANIRSGNIYPNPSFFCTFCPHQHVGNCLPKAEKYRGQSQSKTANGKRNRSRRGSKEN